ncbi:hypothetical protein [Photorhabdus asymbiotica]|uniref:hypothetical protein n=1 Tax=Photorhabdus asymbiotica TaxID=291112 RepID=UPI003DA78815
MLGKICDLNLRWFVTVRDNHWVISQCEQKNIGLSNETNGLVLIATRKEDPDTPSFLSRCLCIAEEAGLKFYIKIGSLEGADQYDHARLSC